MSYRTFKHLLGETSLERKCRFIFGGGILVLVSMSFTWYGRKTEALVINQATQNARILVDPTIKGMHTKGEKFVLPETAMMFDLLDESLSKRKDESLSRQNQTSRSDGYILTASGKPKANGPAREGDKPPDPMDAREAEVLARFIEAAERNANKPPPPNKDFTFADGTSMEVSEPIVGEQQYRYIQAVLFTPDCLRCHVDHGMRQLPNGKWVDLKPGDFACAVVIKVPMNKIYKDINQNRAILIAIALVTAIAAMAASWTIVRYVIVKPVKHLRDVSDAIAAGRLNIRAQIQTGDEFEELSHAFNRMLHNLVSMQQELRDVNHDLDRKVDELAQANLALFEMNRLKSDFLATMSHELRTPLNSIIGFSEVLSGSDQLNDRQKRYAANIQTSGKMLLGMINDILDLAKIESGKMEVRTEDFSIRDVCESLTALARPIADRKNIDLECRLDEAIPLMRQDPGKIRQIIYNLLSNAIKFTPDGGRVSLRAHAEGRTLVLSVADTGIGIAEEDRETIFEKFRQAGHPGQNEGVLTREHQGTGLGLSIVRELSKLLGGDVHLESRPGQGSTFTVRVPLQLPGNRKFEVNLSDERIDLTKARRVEARAALSNLNLIAPESPAAYRKLSSDPLP
ncbi:ATP-binding protein [Tundrisphaera sp. TA3]|uniref:ATP-binding protein n=1 Tax=Tundrisphaera sp. TA3 TaxID=3435775 RepID=UPI003EB88F9A